MSDPEDSTFNYGRPNNYDKYDMKLDQGASRRMRSFYHADPRSTVSLVADSAIYAPDNIKYRLLAQARRLRGRKPLAVTKMNDTEFKQMLSRRRQGNEGVSEKEPLDEYIDSYYKRVHSPNPEPKSPHTEHLRLMYRKLFPKDSDSDSDSSQSDPIPEPGTADLSAAKNYIKFSVQMRSNGGKRASCWDMLQRIGGMAVKGKADNTFLESTASGLGRLSVKLSSHLQQATKKSVRVLSPSTSSRSKPETLHKKPPTKNTDRGIIPVRSMSWLDVSTLEKVARAKKLTVALNKQIASAGSSPIPPDSEPAIRITVGEPKTSTISYCSKTRSTAADLKSTFLSSEFKASSKFHHQAEDVLRTVDPARLIVRRNKKNRAAGAVRVIDYSGLAVGKPSAGESSRPGLRLNSPVMGKSKYKVCLSPRTLRPERPGTSASTTRRAAASDKRKPKPTLFLGSRLGE